MNCGGLKMVDTSRDVELVIKARDEATETIKTINQSLKGVVQTQKSLRTAGAGSDSVFKSLAAGLKSLQSSIGPNGVFGKLAQQTGAFKANITRLMSAIADYKGQMRGLKEEQNSIARSVNNAADKVAKLTTKQEIQNALATESKAALKALGTETAALGREQLALGKTADKLNASLAASQNAIKAANSAIKQGDIDIDRRKAKLEALIGKEKELNAALNNARGAQTARINRGDTSSRAFNNGQARIEKISGQIGKNQSDQQKEIDAITKATAKRNAHIKTIGKEEAAIVQNGVKQDENAVAIANNAAAQEKNNQTTARATQLDKARQGSLKSTDAALAIAEGELAGYNKTLGESERELKKLERNIASSEAQLKGFRKELGAVEAEEKAAQRSLKGLAVEFKTSLDPAIKDAKRVVSGLDEELDNLQKEFNALHAALKSSGTQTTAEARRLASLRGELIALGRARKVAYSGQNNLSQLRTQPVGDLPDLSDRTGRAQVAINQITAGEKELISTRRRGIQVAKELERQERKAAEARLKKALASKKAAAQERRHAEAMRRSAIAGKSNIGVMRRLRTSILAAGSAWLGFHAVLRGLGKPIEDIKKLEAAQNRLRVVVGDDQHVIGEELDFVRRNAERLGIQFGMLAQEYTKFSIATKNTILEGANSRKIFLSVSEAARVNNASTEDLRGTYLALIQIISKGRITMEELKRQLGDRLPGAVHIMAEALGVGTDELLKIVEAGDLSSDKLIEFADTLDKRFGPGLGKALLSTQALIGKFENALFQASLRVAKGGFVEGFNNLLKVLQETLASPAFISFLDRVSVALGGIMNIIAAGVKHWRLLSIVIASLVAAKLASVFINMGKAAFVAIGGITRFNGALRYMRINMNAANTAGRRLIIRLRALRIALFSIGWGVLIAAVGVFAGWLTSTATASTDVNEAMSRHLKIMDKVKNLWDEAAGSIERFVAGLEKMSKLEATANRDSTAKALLSKQDEFVDFIEKETRLAGGKSTNTIGLRGSNASADNRIINHKKLEFLSKLQADSSKFFTGLDSDIRVAREQFTAFKDEVLLPLFEENGIAADSPIATKIIAFMKSIQEGSESAAEAMAHFQAVVQGNPQALLNILDKPADYTLSISELKSKMEGIIATIAAVGDPNLKSIDQAKGKLETLRQKQVDLGETQGLLVAQLKASGLSMEATALKANEYAHANDILAKSLKAVIEQITQLEAFKGAGEGVLGKAIGLIDDVELKHYPDLIKSVSSTINDLERDIANFNNLPANKAAVLVKLQLDGDLTEEIRKKLADGNFEGVQALIRTNNGDKLADTFGGFGVAEKNYLQQNATSLAQWNKEIRANLTNLDAQIRVGQLSKAGLEEQAYIYERLTALLNDPDNFQNLSLEQVDEFIKKYRELFYLEQKEKKGKDPRLKAAEEERQQLEALIALRQAERQLFDLERDRAVGEGRNTKTDPTLNALRDKDKTTGEEIDKLIKHVISLYEELEQTPEVRQALAELAIQFDEIEVAAGRAREVILGWNDLGELGTGSLRGSMDVFIKKIFEGVKGMRALESAFLNLISTFSAKIADVFLDLAAKSAVKGIGKLFGLLIGGIGGGASGDLFKDLFGSNSKFHDGGFVKRGGSKGYDFDINSLHLPRKHDGGLIGLASDEVPAILQTGELVVPRDKVAEAMKGGGGGGQAVPVQLNNYNLWDRKEAQDQILNDDGADEIQRQRISKNPRAWRNAMGIK